MNNQISQFVRAHALTTDICTQTTEAVLHLCTQFYATVLMSGMTY